jgi:vacuolar-type H+-ATPase subunit I/STV1
MKRVVAVVSTLMSGVMVSVGSAGDMPPMQKLIANRNAISQRIVTVSGEISQKLNRIDSLSSCKEKLDETRRIMLLEAEVLMLTNVRSELDKIIFGLELLVETVGDEKKLAELNYKAGAKLYNKALKTAEDYLAWLIDCSSCNPESRLLAKKVLQELREDWR